MLLLKNLCCFADDPSALTSLAMLSAQCLARLGHVARLTYVIIILGKDRSRSSQPNEQMRRIGLRERRRQEVLEGLS